MESLIGIDEVAEILDVKESTVYSWVSEGYIPHIKLGRLVRFDRREILEWVQGLRVRGRKTRLLERNILQKVFS